ncbi:pilus assembly protein [Sphingomonas sp. AP4-R1]|uniref:TadE/TadG family type IV pilus assembly protein n=1 Tax=Sphingomonas sp. AP4-R1 TaxID=2735134 RepID=UPI0014939CB7|nr:TadE family protein [Sphingomonas sp. AP4-R1]QJU59386.1 pilus assembly protein [Sphingomonas sp. AP4-R1]
MSLPRRFAADARGATTVEFAIVAPAFLMMLFLLLDGGRMIFAKQALNELATASARCAALKPTGCTTAAEVQSWTVSRGNTRSAMALTTTMVAVVPSTTCNGQSGMAQATISVPFKKGAMTLLPQSVAPANLTSTSCFPVPN